VTFAELEAKLNRVESQHTAVLRERDQMRHERDEYRKLYELATIELERFRRHIYGQKAERVDPSQTQLAFDAVIESLGGHPAQADQPSTAPNPAPEATGRQGEGTPPPAGGRPKPKERKVTPHGRQKLPEHLPVERIEILPPEAQGESAASLVRIGEEVSETLEWRPASLVRLQVVRPKFAKKGEPESGVLTAPAPEAPITRCMAGPGLLAYVLVCKFADHRVPRRRGREARMAS
jgi:transposase